MTRFYCHPERSEGSREHSEEILRCAQNDRRAGFTLFELILAVALSAVLLTLIGTAINLYLTRVDAGRTRVEEALLARSVLAMIADDIRATTIYQPQDTSAIAQLMAKGSTFDVDSIDKPSQTSSGTSSQTSLGATTGASAASSNSTTGSSTTGLASSSATSNGNSSNNKESDLTMPLGINGAVEELYVDATRLPKQDEIFTSLTGYTNAPSAIAASSAMPMSGAAGSSGVAPPTDLKTVHYFVRPGEALEPGSVSATSLDPANQTRLGGLVRQEIPRASRVFAEQNGNSDTSEQGATLIAPEVVHIEFKYFQAGQVADEWDMKTNKSLPTAVEVLIWLRSPKAANEPVASHYDAASLNNTREYRQVILLPMAQLASSSQTSGTSDTSSTNSTDTSSNSSSSDSTSASGSGFGTE